MDERDLSRGPVEWYVCGKWTYRWACCACGLLEVPYRSAGCPKCGYARCALCTIKKVHVDKSNVRLLPSDTIHRGLPVIFHSKDENQEFMVAYDTGTLENHISLAVAKHLGFSIDSSPEHVRESKLANGKTFRSVGRITARLSFSRDFAGQDDAIVTCDFNVFETLAVPVLVGLIFLQETQTLQKFSSRLVDLPSNTPVPFPLLALGPATNQVPCEIDGNEAVAHADTGSRIALISGEYALRHGLLRDYGCEKLLLADGTIEYTSGFADLEVRVVKKSGQKKRAVSQTVRFHILKNLQFDVVFDEQLVHDFRIFRDATQFFLRGATKSNAWLAPIIHLGRLEQSLLDTSQKISGRIKEWTKSLLAFTEDQKAKQPSSVEDTTIAEDVELRKARLLEKIDQHLQEENRRQDRRRRHNRTQLQRNAEMQIRLNYEEEHKKLVDEYELLMQNNP